MSLFPTTQAFHVALVNAFNLTEECRTRLAGYYILHWRGDYLQTKIDPMNHTIWHADKEYIPIWKDPLNIRTKMMQFKLSFRLTKEDNENTFIDCIPNYVLIKVKE